MRGVGAGTRIFELVDRTPVIRPDTGVALAQDRRGPITFENITFEYPSRKGVEILKDFNLQLNVGESVAIVGKSGSGKSSVAALLMRYYDPLNGKITFDGQGASLMKYLSHVTELISLPRYSRLFYFVVA